MKIGDDLLILFLAEVKERMERYLWVKQVHLLKRYPHRLYIKVVEHQPMALIDLDGLYLINKEGEIFKKLASSDPKNFPVITGISEHDFVKHEGIARMRLQHALRLIRRAHREAVIRNYGLSEIHWEDGVGYVLYTMKPTTQIRVGEYPFDRKFDRFAKAWAFIAITSQAPKVVDLTYERRVIVRFPTS